MRDLIIMNDPEVKVLTLTQAAGPLPAGTEIVAQMKYYHPAFDNDPTKINKASLLSDETQAMLNMPPDSEEYTGTVNLAFQALLTLVRSELEDSIKLAIPTTFQKLMTGRLI